MKKKIVGILVMMLMIATTVLPAVGTINENVVWDNGMNYDVPGTSQWDESSGCDWYAADDFLFEEDTKVIGVRWIGDYHDSGYQEANFDWAFQFYLDQGGGNTPGDEFAGPFIFPHEMCNPVFIEDNGNEKYYEYSVKLPNTLQFSGDEKYWISIWSIGEFPTKAGPAWHHDPIKLHQCVGKSEYFDHPDWQNIEDIDSHEVYIDDPIDTCFQLLTSSPPTVPDITGPSSVKAGESQEYTFSSTDPEGDDISYYIDWGDNSNEICLGPFPSGDEIKSSHKWNEDGTYEIRVKAQDIHGFESDNATLQVSTPRVKTFNNPFIQFLENHFYLFPLLRQLLGLKNLNIN